MKRLIWIALLCVAAPVAAWPQSSTSGPASSGLGQILCSQSVLVASDPVSSRLRQIFDCYSEGVVAMAEEFPADKYAPQQILAMTVGHMVAQSAPSMTSAARRWLAPPLQNPPKKTVDQTKTGWLLF